MIEEWKDIEGFEGKYQISNTGKIRSLNYGRTGNIRELKPAVAGCGYRQVMLYKNKSQKRVFVHRLVAQSFLPNHMNLPEVNHKDEDKTNNCVDNLEWCTKSYNNNYGTRNERVSISLTNRNDLSKKVLCEETGVVYPSTQEAARQTGLFQSCISLCCNGKQKTSGGYHWRYIDKPYQPTKNVLF